MSLQSKILKYLMHQPDTWLVKIVVCNQRGCPDILCCKNGMFIAIEIKEGKDRVSEIQNEQLSRIFYKAKGKIYIAKDFDDFKEWWNTLK